MTSSVPPSDGTGDRANAQAEPATATDAAARSGRAADIDHMSTLAEDLINRGAPWDSRTSWTIVLVEGIVAAIVG